MRTRDEQKEALVKEKALELLVEYGFEGFSMQKLGMDLAKKFADTTLDGFSGQMSLAEGLKKQWENRARYLLSHPVQANAYEVIRHSPVGLEVAKAATRLI